MLTVEFVVESVVDFKIFVLWSESVRVIVGPGQKLLCHRVAQRLNVEKCGVVDLYDLSLISGGGGGGEEKGRRRRRKVEKNTRKN